jgi:pimeloyl-ACP methyl ester carboxylesterase
LLITIAEQQLTSSRETGPKVELQEVNLNRSTSPSCLTLRRSVLRATAGGVLALLLVTAAAVAAQGAVPSARPAAQGDFAGLVDIGGGRQMYLECRGQGGPTVILVSGYPNAGGIWSVQSEELPQPPVMPAVAGFTRVCAYDRPGTLLVRDDVDDPTVRSRSDPVPQPRTAEDTVADLHALLRAAQVPGPYVLAGHSLGGLLVRLYASRYPDEVAGLVLVDATSEYLRAALTPELWALTAEMSGVVSPELASSYPEVERVDFHALYDAMVRAAAAQPLRQMPLVVLSRSREDELPPEFLEGLPPEFPDALAASWRASQASLAALLPGARQVIVPAAGHYIQVEQPQAVIDAIGQVVTAVRDPASWPRAAVGGDFAGLVDIGGRRLYLDCQGTGSPTVLLEAGYRSPATVWSDDLIQPQRPRTMVLEGVGAATRVCLYERPGTAAVLDEDLHPSRSDPVPQPRSPEEVIADLQALLRTAGVPGPYVLVGHSLGGLFVRLYTATYPADVVGLVLVDAWYEGLQERLTPGEWAAYVRVTSEVPPELAAYRDLETIDFAAASAAMRQAAVAQPLPAVPLAVLAHSQPFGLSEDQLGFSPEALEGAWGAAQEQLATLVPRARYTVAAESAHYIQLQQPALVIEAIRQVVVGVREPDTWHDLVSCCRP